MPAALMPRRGNSNPLVEKTEVQRCSRKSLRCLVEAFGVKSTSEGSSAGVMKQGYSGHRSSLFSFTYSGSYRQMRPVFFGEDDEERRVVFVTRVNPRIVSSRQGRIDGGRHQHRGLFFFVNITMRVVLTKRMSTRLGLSNRLLHGGCTQTKTPGCLTVLL